jgi:hypothetical protein
MTESTISKHLSGIMPLPGASTPNGNAMSRSHLSLVTASTAAPSDPDPIYALMEKVRQTANALNGYDGPCDDEYDDLEQDYHDAQDEIRGVMPITRDGLLAYLDFIITEQAFILEKDDVSVDFFRIVVRSIRLVA